MESIDIAVKEFVLREFLPGAHPSELTEATPLITGAILDSLATLRLVVFLEERFGIELQAHEASVDYLDTVESIGDLVRSKLATAPPKI